MGLGDFFTRLFTPPSAGDENCDENVGGNQYTQSSPEHEDNSAATEESASDQSVDAQGYIREV